MKKITTKIAQGRMERNYEETAPIPSQKPTSTYADEEMKKIDADLGYIKGYADALHKIVIKGDTLSPTAAILINEALKRMQDAFSHSQGWKR